MGTFDIVSSSYGGNAISPQLPPSNFGRILGNIAGLLQANKIVDAQKELQKLAVTAKYDERKAIISSLTQIALSVDDNRTKLMMFREIENFGYACQMAR